MPVAITTMFRQVTSLLTAGFPPAPTATAVSAMRRRELRRMPGDYGSARAFFCGARQAALAVLTDDNHPRVIVVDVLAAPEGGLLFTVSRDSGDSLLRNHCSLVITGSACAARSGTRLTLEAQVGPAADAAVARMLAAHPRAAAQSRDMRILHADVRRARWVAGTGRARWLEGDGFAGPFPWGADAERRAIERLNHGPRLLRQAPSTRAHDVNDEPRGRVGAPVRVVALDPAGLWLRIGDVVERFNFPCCIDDPEQAADMLARG